jgi:hypothetical protein
MGAVEKGNPLAPDGNRTRSLLTILTELSGYLPNIMIGKVVPVLNSLRIMA